MPEPTVSAEDAGRYAALYPAIAEAARRAEASAIGLIDVGRSAGLNLNVDRVGITYSDGRSLGDPTSPVQVACTLRGDRPVPARTLPNVVARIGIDHDPLDYTAPDDARWLRGDPIALVPHAVAAVPQAALPVFLTTWSLSRLGRERRPQFLLALEAAAVERPVAWVSAEGVGVAPGIPTLGDRPASGHSILGLAMFDGATRSVEAIGRCWSRGRWLAWLAES